MDLFGGDGIIESASNEAAGPTSSTTSNPVDGGAATRKGGGPAVVGVLMSNGWIHLHRKLDQNPLWLSEPMTKGQAWVDLLMLANHKDGNSFQIRGNWVHLKPGDVGWSKENLAIRWKWSRNKVLRFISLLEKLGQVKQQKSKLLTVISIVNWDLYQKTEQQTKQQTGQQKDIRRSIIKNVKNVENEKKERAAAAAGIPEVIDAFKEVNPAYRKWFSNTTQRSSAERLIQSHGLDMVLKVVGMLSKTNGMRFFPSITTPVQLEDKWAALKIAFDKKKSELEASDWRKNVIA